MKFKIALIAAALAVSSSAFAADKKNSISVFGTVVGSSGSDPVGVVAVGFNRLVSDSVELGFFYSTSFANGSRTSSGNLNVKYLFGAVGKAGSVLPYVTGSVGASGGDSSDTARVLEGGAGVEFMMTESASTFIEAVYTRNTIDSASTNGYRALVGIKLRF